MSGCPLLETDGADDMDDEGTLNNGDIIGTLAEEGTNEDKCCSNGEDVIREGVWLSDI